MGKKTVKNRYGVQVGDIFNWKSHHEDGGGYSFYQVIALRGETQVMVREIGSKVIAFDGVYEGVAPISDAWISDKVLVRKVCADGSTPNAGLKMFEDGICGVSIKIENNWLGYAYLDRKELYLAWNNGPNFAYIFGKYNRELAKQLDLQNGSGVFAVDRPFESYGDDCYAVIRYPDGREQKTVLSILLHYEEEKRIYERLNSPEFAQKREKLLDEWMASQKGAVADE